MKKEMNEIKAVEWCVYVCVKESETNNYEWT